MVCEDIGKIISKIVKISLDKIFFICYYILEPKNMRLCLVAQRKGRA